MNKEASAYIMKVLFFLFFKRSKNICLNQILLIDSQKITLKFYGINCCK